MLENNNILNLPFVELIKNSKHSKFGNLNLNMEKTLICSDISKLPHYAINAIQIYFANIPFLARKACL